jgi:hypothetical protein
VTLGNALNPNFATSGTINFNNGVTLGAGATVNMGTSAWRFTPGGGTQTIGTTAGSATINIAGGTLQAGFGGGQTLQIASGITIQGHGTLNQSSSSTINNAGTIKASTAGQSFNINPTSFSNSGTLSLTAGTMTVSSTNWSNTGTFNVGPATTLNINGNVLAGGLGNFNRTGGSVNVSGNITNTGGTLDIGGGGVFGPGGLTSLSGSITGGTVVSGDGTVLTGRHAGRGDAGQCAESELRHERHHQLQQRGDAGQWRDGKHGDQRVALHAGGRHANDRHHGGQRHHQHRGRHDPGGVWRRADVADRSGITIQGHGTLNQSSASTINNAGTIKASTAGQSFNINPTSFSNSGTLSLTAGTMTVSSTNWSNTGTFNVGPATTLNINGNVLAGGWATSTAPAARSRERQHHQHGRHAGHRRGRGIRSGRTHLVERQHHRGHGGERRRHGAHRAARWTG